MGRWFKSSADAAVLARSASPFGLKRSTSDVDVGMATYQAAQEEVRASVVVPSSLFGEATTTGSIARRAAERRAERAERRTARADSSAMLSSSSASSSAEELTYYGAMVARVRSVSGITRVLAQAEGCELSEPAGEAQLGFVFSGAEWTRRV